MLSGKIEVDDTVIGWWKAKRQGEVNNDLGNTYNCEVQMFPPCHPEQHRTDIFAVRHFYEDGAAVLASKVLWQFALRQPTDHDT